jgi:uncharacterized membrane protein YhaH (DUF805 family)
MKMLGVIAVFSICFRICFRRGFRRTALLDLLNPRPLADFPYESREIFARSRKPCPTHQTPEFTGAHALREDAMDQIDINKLWGNFVDTVTNHYTDFNGRVGREQFWYYVLVYVVIGIAVAVVGNIIAMGAPLRGLYGLLLFLPNVGMTARRLQDTGRPGTWAWLLAVPVAMIVLMGLFTLITLATFGLGAIFFLLTPFLGLVSLAAIVVLIYFCAQPGTAGPNEFGPVPAAWTPGSPAKPTAS